jgi:S-adenosylmethionine/arginine decarboxylase-like enzyme
VHSAPGPLFGDAVFVDVFSCQTFDPVTATTITVDHFHAQTVDTRLRARGAPTTII